MSAGALPHPPPAPLDHSIARQEFASAITRLSGRPLDDARVPLPLRYEPPRREPAAAATLEPTDAPHDAPRDAPLASGAGAPPSDDPIAAALRALVRGEVTVAELLAQTLHNIERRDPALHAIVELLADAAATDAARLDRELRDGSPPRALHGIPITVKDVIDVAGAPTRGGSEAYLGHPDVDAVAVRRLRDAGAIVVAKVATHEFALGVTNPQSRNPHDPSRIPGGSSGGSAIAVATGMGLASLGTDTRASIRVPSSLSGAVGLKPTFGRVPTTGVLSLSWTMDHVGPLATTVGDAARILDVLVAAPPDHRLTDHVGTPDHLGRCTRFGGTSVRIGVPPAGFTGTSPDVALAVTRAAEQLEAAGAAIVPVEHPSDQDFDDANALGLVISRTEAATFHRELGTDLERCWTEIADQLGAALAIPAVDYLAAQRRRGELAERLLAVFDHVDVVAYPTTLVTAPPVDDFAAFLMVLSRNAIPWSLIGFPAMSVPCGFDPHGLPIGLQLVAPPDREDVLVAVGSAYEALRG